MFALFWVILLSGSIATVSYAQTYTVERVIDGDTIVVTTSEGKSETVELIGIDTPESKPNDKAKRDSKRTGKDLETINKMGQEATEFVKGLIKEGQEVELEFDVQERDKYGRILAYVYYEIVLNSHLKDIVLYDPFKYGKFAFRGNGSGYKGTFVFLNATIIKSGYATPMTIPPNVKYADLFKELYEEARAWDRTMKGLMF